MAADPDALRTARESYSVIYRQIILLAADELPPLICIVEGVDGGYYHPRVHHWMVQHAIDCGLEFLNSSGRDNVLKIRDAVEKNATLSRVVCLYFIDRDFNPANDNARHDTYVTDGYSVENLYASERSVRAIICSHALHDEIDDAKRAVVDLVMERYCYMREQFAESARRFNCWVRVQRREFQQRVSLRTLDAKAFVHVAIGDLTAELQIGDAQLAELPLPDQHPSAAQVDAECDAVGEEIDIYLCRGKQALFFVISFLEDFLKESGSADSEIYIDGRHGFQVSGKTFIRDFSQYAETPASLIAFLENVYRERFAA